MLSAMRGARVAVGGLLVLFSGLYVVGWVRMWPHAEYLRSFATAWDELLWLGTSVAVVVLGALVLVATIGLIRGREPRRWVTWTTLAALCAAGALPAVRAMSVTRSEIPFLPDPFRSWGPAEALYLPFTDALVWRGAAVPFTVLALLWACPLLVAELAPARHARATVAGIGVIGVLTGSFLHSLLSAATLAAFA